MIHTNQSKKNDCYPSTNYLVNSEFRIKDLNLDIRRITASFVASVTGSSGK